MKFRCLLIALWLALGIFPNDAPGQDSAAEIIKIIEGPQLPDRKGLDPFTLEELMDRAGVPGVSIAVIKDFKIHWAKAYGSADVKTGDKVNTETLFQAASISKTLNAMAVAATTVELCTLGAPTPITTAAGDPVPITGYMATLYWAAEDVTDASVFMWAGPGADIVFGKETVNENDVG